MCRVSRMWPAERGIFFTLYSLENATMRVDETQPVLSQ